MSGRRGEGRGRPKASAQEVSTSLILSPWPGLKFQEGWGTVVLAAFGVSELTTWPSHVDSIFAEGITKSKPVLTPPPQAHHADR